MFAEMKRVHVPGFQHMRKASGKVLFMAVSYYDDTFKTCKSLSWLNDLEPEFRILQVVQRQLQIVLIVLHMEKQETSSFNS